MAGWVAAGSAALGVAGQMGLFGKPKQYGYSTGDIDKMSADRGGEIDSFAKELADMRSQYMAQIPGLNTATFNQFGADAAAKFGANGIGVDSGAFASSLAREALPLQRGMYDAAYSSGVGNANAVNSSRASLFASRLGAASAGLSAPTANPAWAGLGNFGGQAGLMALYQNGQKPNPGTPPAMNPFSGEPMMPGMPGNPSSVQPSNPNPALSWQS